ncbi:MAG: hypothetical protein ACTHLR_10945 [Rhizomicrobium sp.]
MSSYPANFVRRAALCMAAMAVVSLSGCGREQKLAPDFAFNFRCHGDAPEDAIAKFVASQGFTVFNEERVRRQYNLALYPLAIDGYNAKHWMLYFRGINEKSGDKPDPHATIYSVGIYSPPPTRHDARLESATQHFVAATLRCDVLNVSHADNGADRLPFFEKVYQAEQKRIAAGMRCDKQSGRPLDTKCPN